MKLTYIIDELKLKLKNNVNIENIIIKSGYTGDLLSDVMANALEDSIWITIQKHPNIIAVATLKDISAIIITNSQEPYEETLKKAEENNIPIFTTEKTSFEISGMVYELLKS